MRVFKTKWMTRYSRREKIADADLLEAIDRAERGLIDADLEGGLIKQRVARKGQGKSGGYRMIVVYRAGDRAVFIYGFAKSERENINNEELETMREITADLLSADEARLSQSLNEERLQEISHDDETA